VTDVQTAPESTRSKEGSEPGGGFIWYELMTTDAAGAKDFYDAVVGWNIAAESEFPNGYRMIGRSDGKFAGGVLPLNDEMQQHGAKPTWLGYIYVEDVDAAVASIEQVGGQALMPAFDIPEVGRVAMISDPQGAAFYIMKPIPPANDPKAESDVFSPTEQQRVGWNELSTSDPSAARRFYTSHFGWDDTEFMPMGEMGEYRFLAHDGTRIGALCGTMPGGQTKWRYYFRVPSIKAAIQSAEQNGGTINMGPHQVPTGDWIVIGTDPQGAEFALVGGE